MVSNPKVERNPVMLALQRSLGRARFVSLLVLLVLLGLCIAFSWTTRGATAHLSFLRSAPGPASRSTIVDLDSWQIAQALRPLAVSREEVEFAHEAERLADHEVNQAFAMALRQAGARRPAPEGATLALARKITQLQQMAKDDQARVHALTAGAATEDDLKIAQAQFDLDTDELNDAQHDLARASGDVRGQIQQELAAHQAAMSKLNGTADADSQMAVLSARQYGTLAGRIEAWSNQHSRYQLLQQALQQARADGASLTAQHNALESQADASAAAAANTTSAIATAGSAGRFAALQREREQRQLLSIYDDRIQTQQQLDNLYSKWATQVLLQHRIVLHMAMRSLEMIACILICVIVCEFVGTSLLERHAMERRRLQTLRIIVRFGTQLAGLVCVLLITFGVPSQISTILGLATAGLTVALQSFILAFFGWFILMGKNGVRVGDWVEINGVAGEVMEINLFRTTLLETRDWAVNGHPTGRRATFINNFAITGQFFNFSTVGQWMWDEMSVSIPSSVETYEKIAQINQVILEETQQNAQLAEGEWKRVLRQNSLCHASAASSVHMRPAGAGVEVLIRYVTRASERLDVRNRVYERVLEVLHKAEAVIQPAKPSKLTAAVLAAGDPVPPSPGDKRHSMYT